MPAEFPPPAPPPASFARPPTGRPGPARGRAVEAGRGSAWWGDGWRLFRAAPGVWIGILVVYLLIVVGLSAIPWLGQIASGLLAPVLAAGVMVGCGDLDRGEPLRVAHLFACFDDRLAAAADRVGRSTSAAGSCCGCSRELRLRRRRHRGSLLALLSGDPSALASSALAGLGLGALVVMLLVLLLSIPLMMAFWFAPALIALRGDEPVAAMKASFSGSLPTSCRCSCTACIGLVLAIVASIPFGLGWLVLGPVLGGSRLRELRATSSRAGLTRGHSRPARPRRLRAAALRPRPQCACSQLGPAPTSTTSGTSSAATPVICPGSSRFTRVELGRRHLEHQLVVHLQDQAASHSRAASSQSCTASIASLTRSAAVPCIGALIAARSAPARRGPPAALMSGSHSRRPNTVST